MSFIFSFSFALYSAVAGGTEYCIIPEVPYDIEEIAWRKGFITTEQLYKLGEETKSTDYGKYIMELAKKDLEKSNILRKLRSQIR